MDKQLASLANPARGKSRLLYEFRQALGTEKVTYLEGRCLSHGSSIPYVPVLDIVRQNFDLSEADREDAIAEKVRLGVAEVGLDAEEWGPLLLLFLGVRQGTEHVSALTPETIKARTFEMLRQFSLAGSMRQAIIFAIEDLHWIDKTSEEYLLSLVESLSGAPIFLGPATGRHGWKNPSPRRCLYGHYRRWTACGWYIRRRKQAASRSGLRRPSWKRLMAIRCSSKS